MAPAPLVAPPRATAVGGGRMKCSHGDCERESRMAVRTTRPTREDLRVTVYVDDRVAPKTAQRYCKECGLKTVRDVLNVVVDADG